MPAFTVQRSIDINAPLEKVFDTVADYGTWTTWSPWLRIGKDAVVTVTDDPQSVGSIYRWQGDVVGQGEMEHRHLDRPRSIEDVLRIVKPFKSRSDVRFDLESVGNATRITWRMDGNLPWFLFWMKPMMQTFVGMDYERGLKMLCEYVETGEVLSSVDVVGTEATAAMDVYGVRTQCSMDDMGTAVNDAIAVVRSALGACTNSADTQMVSVYHDFNMKQRQFDFTVGFTVSRHDALPTGLVHCHVPIGRALHVRHTGRYENLGNAWSGSHQYARYKKLKLARRDSFEIYRNDPKTTPAADRVTDVYVPLR